MMDVSHFPFSNVLLVLTIMQVPAGQMRVSEQIVIREFEGKLSSIGLPDPDIHVGKKQFKEGSQTHRRRILIKMMMIFQICTYNTIEPVTCCNMK